MDNVFEKAKEFIFSQSAYEDTFYTSDQQEALAFVATFLLKIEAITNEQYIELHNLFIKG